jgi:signal transduction histidine kinase
LLKNLLNYARPAKPQLDFINLHEILDTMIKVSEMSLKSPSSTSGLLKDIKFVKDFDSDMPLICADGGQLKQVALNLILNGIDAIAEKGTITIKTVRSSKDSIEIMISDTGNGIDQKDLKMVFNPFFTNKTKGTGLGLAITKRLIEQHKGSIDVVNNREGGATFIITLPVKQENGWGKT